MSIPLSLSTTSIELRDISNAVAGVAILAQLTPADQSDLLIAARQLRGIASALETESERALDEADDPPG